MATKLTTSYQLLGSFVPIGSGSSNETRCKLYAKIDSQDASGATIRARATVDLRWSSFSTTNGQYNLTGSTTASSWSKTGSVTPNNYFVNGSWSLSRGQTSYATVYDQSKTITLTNADNEFTLGLHFKIITNSQTYEGSTGNVSVYFTPQETAPVYNSINATQISSNSVSLSASVSDGGSTITDGGFQLSTDGGETWTDYPGDWTSMTISSLSRVTTYTYRGYATNAKGTTYSTPSAFTTLAEAPLATLIKSSNYTATSALLESTWDDGGSAITAGGFQVSADNGATWTSYPGSWTSQTVTGLTPSTNYLCRSYATNAIGTSYSNSLTFSTTDISNVSVSLNGGAFTTAKLKVSINGQAFVDLSSSVKTSINGGSFH